MKKLQEYLQEAKNELFYREPDYNRSQAITEFILELEGTEKNFQFVSGNIVLINMVSTDNRILLEEKKKPSLNRYCSFNLNNTHYYMQYDSNYFFETSYIGIVSNRKNEYYKRIRIFNTIELETLYSTKEEAIQDLKQHLKIKFAEIKCDNYSLNLPVEQTVYI